MPACSVHQSCEMGALASTSDDVLQQLRTFEVRLCNLAAIVGAAATCVSQCQLLCSAAAVAAPLTSVCPAGFAQAAFVALKARLEPFLATPQRDLDAQVRTQGQLCCFEACPQYWFVWASACCTAISTCPQLDSHAYSVCGVCYTRCGLAGVLGQEAPYA